MLPRKQRNRDQQPELQLVSSPSNPPASSGRRLSRLKPPPNSPPSRYCFVRRPIDENRRRASASSSAPWPGIARRRAR